MFRNIFAIWFFCAVVAHASTEIEGEPVNRGKGSMRTFMKFDYSGKLLEMGLRMTHEVLEGLPQHDPLDFIVPFPNEALATPFTHMYVNWNPHGHWPVGVYDVPHFDFHFSMMNSADREKITCAGDDLAVCTKVPDDFAFVPQDYVMVPGGTWPKMGSHWIDPNTPELHGQPFTKTMLFGFYDGHMVFVEPMIALSYLLTLPNDLGEIKQPQKYEGGVSQFPILYSISFNHEANEYVVSIQGFNQVAR